MGQSSRGHDALYSFAVCDPECPVSYDEPHVHCPVCGVDTVHVEGAEVRIAGGTGIRVVASGEDEQATLTVEPVENPDRYTRRMIVILLGWCEQAHHFELWLNQHKGTTYTGLEYWTEEPPG